MYFRREEIQREWRLRQAQKRLADLLRVSLGATISIGLIHIVFNVIRLLFRTGGVLM